MSDSNLLLTKLFLKFEHYDKVFVTPKLKFHYILGYFRVYGVLSFTVVRRKRDNILVLL